MESWNKYVAADDDWLARWWAAGGGKPRPVPAPGPGALIRSIFLDDLPCCVLLDADGLTVRGEGVALRAAHPRAALLAVRLVGHERTEELRQLGMAQDAADAPSVLRDARIIGAGILASIGYRDLALAVLPDDIDLGVRERMAVTGPACRAGDRCCANTPSPPRAPAQIAAALRRTLPDNPSVAALCGELEGWCWPCAAQRALARPEPEVACPRCGGGRNPLALLCPGCWRAVPKKLRQRWILALQQLIEHHPAAKAVLAWGGGT